MPARPTWKGYLKISLVNIPIKVFPATDAGATLSFNQLHGECQTRIQQKRWCPKCEREVPNTDIVKGYEVEKGNYVVMISPAAKMLADGSPLAITTCARSSTFSPRYVNVMPGRSA